MTLSPDLEQLIQRTRDGDVQAFHSLYDLYVGKVLNFAYRLTGSRETAEEVAQETWVALLDGLDDFEGRSTLKTWLFRVLVNRARTRAKRAGREIPFDVQEDEAHPDESRLSGKFWRLSEGPRGWSEADIDNKRVLEIVRREVERLPEAQRAVVIMRDIEGLDAKEVCNVLSIQETHQRVLLHRGRAKLRAAIERELGER